MRSMRTLGTLVVVGGTVGLVYGCSAAGNAPVGVGDDATPDGSAPSSYGSGSEPNSDGGSTAGDSGAPRKDAGGGYIYDAGSATKAPVGSPCDASLGFGDPEATESCGLCGTQTRICATADGGTKGVWDVWGLCAGEVTTADKCDPALTYTATACGNCGTMPKVCQPDCHLDTTFDCSEPINACHPTDTKFVLGASCTTAGQGRVYTCGATCSFGSPSACEVPPPNPNTLTIATTTSGSVNKIFNLSSTNLTPRTSGSSCPNTLSSDSTSFVDVALVNPNARDVTVNVWDGPAVSGDSHDTVMAWYPTPAAPPSDRTQCTSANDDCDTGAATCAGSPWSSLNTVDDTAVVVPANGTVTVYIGMYHTSESGNVKLFAKNTN